MSAVTPIEAGGKQTQDAMNPRVRPESCCNKWCCTEPEDSYADADGLLQTLLLLSTLTLAFAVTLHSGTLGHADFEEADFRWSKHMYYQRLRWALGPDKDGWRSPARWRAFERAGEDTGVHLCVALSYFVVLRGVYLLVSDVQQCTRG